MIQRIKKYTFYTILVILLTVNAIPSGAEDTVDILPIRSVPVIKNPASRIPNALQFDGGGTVQRVGKDEEGRNLIVIDDRLRYFADGVKYYNVKGESVSSVQVYKGKTVGYFLNLNKEITGLHLTK